jgi:hypothetical protein
LHIVGRTVSGVSPGRCCRLIFEDNPCHAGLLVMCAFQYIAVSAQKYLYVHRFCVHHPLPRLLCFSVFHGMVACCCIHWNDFRPLAHVWANFMMMSLCSFLQGVILYFQLRRGCPSACSTYAASWWNLSTQPWK